MPLTGEIILFNESLENNPELVNTDPYGEGWMIKVKYSNINELDALLDKIAYEALLN
jgi:glycine cleavage system H protein